MKRVVNRILWFFIVLVLVFTGCSKQPAETFSVPQFSRPTHAYDSLELEFGDFHTKAQAAYLMDAVENISPYGTGEGERSAPRGTEFILPVKEDAKSILYLSMKEDFSDEIAYPTTGSSIKVYNLLLDTTYYWRVESEEGKIICPVQSFHTTNVAPRNLLIDGVANVRDMGGWKTTDGTMLRQGVLFRGGRFNTNSREEMVLEIKDAGKNCLINELGIKTEIDLRRVEDMENGNAACADVVEGIHYVSCPMQFNNAETFNDEANIASLQKVFEILGDEASYPVYFHCSVGTDRTGIIAFLINGYLGVSEEELYRDYAFSNFSVIGGPRSVQSIRENYETMLEPYDGVTLSEKIQAFLLDKGVMREQLDTIRKMLL